MQVAAAPPRQAVILAAGLGSRFGGPDDIKQLAGLGALGLIDRNCRLLERHGLERVIFVTGHRAEAVEPALRQALAERRLALDFVHNPEFRLSNGISAWRGAEAAGGPFVLLMADHVFDERILSDAVTHAPPLHGGVLYVDRKIATVFDIDDATKVRLDGERIVAIGKKLETYDAIDTGLFVMSPDLIDALRQVYQRRGDCSLSEGVQALADQGVMLARDIRDARWQDVDTLDDLQHAIGLFGDGS